MTTATASLRVSIGPEQTLMPGALQPFMFHAGDRLVVCGQLPVHLGIAFPGVFGASYSDDSGKTWKEWKRSDLPGGHPFFEGCAVRMKSGECLMLPWCASGPDAKGNWVAVAWRSNDNWRNIVPEQVSIHLPQAKGGYDDDGHPVGGIFLHRSIIELPSGELLMTAYCWFHEDNTPSTYRPVMNKFRTIILRSTDRGSTWSLLCTAAVDPNTGEEGFNEPALVRLSQGKHAGRLVMHLRTGSNKTYPHCPIYQTVSDDNGKTWSKPHALNFENVNPDLLEMKSGILVAGYGYRTPESRVHLVAHPPKTLGKGHGNWLAFSLDGGDTWEQHTQVTKEPSTCYVAMAEVTPGKLTYVYDIGDAWQHVWIGYENIQRSLGCRIIDISR